MEKQLKKCFNSKRWCDGFIVNSNYGLCNKCKCKFDCDYLVRDSNCQYCSEHACSAEGCNNPAADLHYMCTSHIENSDHPIDDCDYFVDKFDIYDKIYFKENNLKWLRRLTHQMYELTEARLFFPSHKIIIMETEYANLKSDYDSWLSKMNKKL